MAGCRLTCCPRRDFSTFSWARSTQRGRWTRNVAERETLLIEHQWGAGYYGERRILLKNWRGVDPGAGGEVRLAEGNNSCVCRVFACAV